MTKNNNLLLHCLIEKGEKYFSAICLELDVASQGRTIKEAEANIKEAIELYLEDVYEAGDEKEFIPRPAPMELWLRYFKLEERKLRGKFKKVHKVDFEIEKAVAG